MRLGLIVLFSTSISAQVLSVGAMGGLPLTDAMAINASQIVPGPIISGLPPFDTCAQCVIERTVPYIIGPAVEARLKGSFSLDLEALYSRVDYNRSFGGVSGFGPGFAPTYVANVTATKHTINRWEFPVLLKYTMRAGHQLRPFVEGGISIQGNWERQTQGLTGFTTPVFAANLSVKPSESSAVNRSVIEGATFGIGASYGIRRVRPSLEFRYTRWFDKAFTVDSGIVMIPPTPIPHIAYSVMNQAQILLGIMF
jgi:hypothetical protein